MIKTRSLTRRLFLLAALWNGVALGLSWVGLSLLFERHTERQVRSELIRQGEALVSVTSLAADGMPQVAQTLTDPRFTRPASGLYYYVASPKGHIASRSLWDGIWIPATSAQSQTWQDSTTAGPFEARMIRVSRIVRPDANGPAVLVEIGLDHRVITAARADFAREMALFLGVLWSVLTLASVVQVTQGLKPLAALRARLGALEASAQARLDDQQYPTEVGPLIGAINALADARAADMARARDRARDLAHALKTPLTALKMQVSGLSETGPKAELQDSLNILSVAVQAELARAQPFDDRPVSCAAHSILARLVRVISQTPAGSRLRFEIDLDDSIFLPLGEDAAFEVFGALLDNASRHAHSLIRITAQQASTGLCLRVEDDGPGLGEEDRGRALSRGVRLDEASGTQGLGLAISADLIRASGGTMRLTESGLGGLGVELMWQ
ncbi:virulence sensor histidine kinase PhoQ [Candidatus Phycosocius bacilliformis]|uniref:histidine kinase n=1 Tax=Candidatus Phycosocius bacilliformis TaxID=1445552 RepID=A0A2P2EE31_9PROT|nr:sensor histidine kinase [Candidatus Phycosocius bacilliformis]GBF59320.1 virulence sensor histidine kinase PhoQ [Candidatus Phycosocius bacilliformis]